jgi:hypothetical protein
MSIYAQSPEPCLVHQASHTPPCPLVSVFPSSASYALQSCSVLMGELFAPCSTYLSPVPYFEQCRRDACRCGQPCLCATLAHYAHLCRRHGLPVNFRARLPACGKCPTPMQHLRVGCRSLGSRPECLLVPQTLPPASQPALLLCSPSLPMSPCHQFKFTTSHHLHCHHLSQSHLLIAAEWTF